MKNLLNLGKVLNKAEQKAIHGGGQICCEWCPDGSCNDWTTGPTPCPIAPPCS